jgi:hypothetical protein
MALMGLVTVSSLHAAEEPALVPASVIEVSVRDDLVTLRARNAPLIAVLEEIAAQAGFTFKPRGNLNRIIGWSFTGIPVEVAIRRLLRRESSVMTYHPATSGRSLVLAKVVAWDTTDRSAADISIEQTILRRDPEPDETTDLRLAFKTPRLEAFLETLEPADRDRARQRLAELPEETSTEAITALLSKDEDPTVRTIAVIGLGSMREESAKEALFEALADGDRQVRLQAIYALGKLWGDDALESLGEVLLKDPDPVVRRDAAITMARSADEEALEALRQAQFDGDPMVQEVVAHALARLDDR